MWAGRLCFMIRVDFYSQFKLAIHLDVVMGSRTNFSVFGIQNSKHTRFDAICEFEDKKGKSRKVWECANKIRVHLTNTTG